MKNYLALILLFTFCKGIAQEKSVWSLERCIDYALKNNLEIKQGNLQKEISESQLIMNKQAFLPDLNFSGDHIYYFGRSVDPTTNTFNTSTTQTNTFSLSSSIDLFSGLGNLHALKRNKLEIQALTLDQENLKAQIELNIAVAYLNVLQTEEQIKQAKIQKENLYSQRDMITAMIEGGIAPEADKIEIEAAINNQQEVIENMTLQLNNAILQIKNLMQLPFEEEFAVQTDIDIELDTAYLLVSGESTSKNAAGWNPSIKSFFYKNQVSDLEIKIAKSNYIPKLSMFGGASTRYSNQFVNFDGTYTIIPIGFPLNNPLDIIVAPQPNFSKVPFGNQISGNLSYVLGLRLSVPIYNRGEVKNAVVRQEIARKQRDFEYETTLRKLEFDIEQRVAETKASFELLKVAMKGVSISASSYVVASEKYKAGIINIYEFINAQNNFYVAESRLVQNKYRHLFNLLIIDFYNGEPLRL